MDKIKTSGSGSDNSNAVSPNKRALLLGALGGAATALMPGLSAHAQPAGVPESLIAAAKKEGAVTFYSSYTPTHSQAVGAAFTKLYGIPVTTLRLVVGQMIARYSAERDSKAPSADVLVQSDQLFQTDAVRKGWLMKFGENDLPALKSWPKKYWIDGSYAPVILLPWGFSYNTKKLTGADVPRGWEDLIKPRYRNEILFTDPKASLPLLLNIAFLEKTFGENYLRSFARQNFQLIPSFIPGLQQLAAGEKSVIVQAIPGADEDLIKSGAPVKTVIPEKHTGFAQFAAASTSAPHPNAAKLFLNFILTREGQEHMVKNAGYSVLDNVPGALPGKVFELYDWAQLSRDRARLLGLLGL